MLKDNRVMAYVYTSDFLRDLEEGAIDLPGGIVVKVLPGGMLDRQDMYDE